VDEQSTFLLWSLASLFFRTDIEQPLLERPQKKMRVLKPFNSTKDKSAFPFRERRFLD